MSPTSSTPEAIAIEWVSADSLGETVVQTTTLGPAKVRVVGTYGWSVAARACFELVMN